MFATPDYEMIFLNNCEEKINDTLSVCKKLRSRYDMIIKSSKLSKEEKKIYKEKIEKNNKDIEYYENAINSIKTRRVEVQRLIDNGNKY